MINLKVVQILGRSCTYPSKDLYRVKKGDVQILFYSYGRKYLIKQENEFIYTVDSDYSF